MVGGGELMVTERFASLIFAFQKQHPFVRFNYFTGTTDEIDERMNHGLIDAAILVCPFDTENFDYISLGPDARWGVYLRADDVLSSKDHIQPSDLHGRALILPSRKKLKNEIISWLGEEFKSMTVPVTENLGGNAGLFVEASGFCALSSEGAVPMYDEKKLKFIPLYPERRIQTAIAWKRNVPRTPAVKAFLRFCKEALTDRSS